MTGWELFKTLVREVGWYRRKLVFFLLFVFVAAAGYFVWQNYFKPESAVVAFSEFATPPPQVNLEVEVQKTGKVLVNGKKNNRALKYYDEYDELRILVFDSPGYFIGNFSGTVHLPGDVSSDRVRQIVYAVHGVGAYKYYMSDSQTLVYEASDISPQSMLTIVADLPKGIVTPSALQNLKLQLGRLSLKIWFYIAVALPLITAVILIFMLLKRHSAKIFSPSSRGFLGQPPTDDPPAVAGVLIDGTVGAREIAATLIDLARRGYIYIINKGGQEFSFGVRKSGDWETMPGLQPFERALLSKIFMPKTFRATAGDIEMRLGRHIFSRRIAQFYLEVYNQATRQGYFVQNPTKVHLNYKYLGIALFFLSFFGFVLNSISGADPKFSLLFWLGGMAAALCVIQFSPYMPVRSGHGVRELKEWLAFREYLTLKQPAAPAETLQGKFEEYLPFAIVLAAEVEWSRRFIKSNFYPPEWYESPTKTITLDSFMGELMPLIGYVAKNLAKSHEPTVE